MLDFLLVFGKISQELFLLSNYLVFKGLLQLLNLLAQIFILLLQLLFALLHVGLVLFSHEGFAHAKRNRRFIQSLVGLDVHLLLVSDTHEQESSLSTVDCDLTDKLIKALGKELFSLGTNASLSDHPSFDQTV